MPPYNPSGTPFAGTIAEEHGRLLAHAGTTDLADRFPDDPYPGLSRRFEEPHVHGAVG